MTTGTVVAPDGDDEPRHILRIALLWALFTAVLVPVIVFVVGPHIPPYDMSVQSQDQHQVNVALAALAMPVVGLVWVGFGYSIVVFRQRGDVIVDGPHIVGTPRPQITWLAVTLALVLGLATYGTVGLLGDSHGAGGGQGSNPLARPPASTHPLQVQVIGQQWAWTFRYPSAGGVETASLMLPVDRWVELHVTSLDVIHSFWAVGLAVKADAVPGTDNIAYVKATHTGGFMVRCAELCGLWHGQMYSHGGILAPARFAAWLAARRTQFAAITRDLPPYSLTYYPDPQRRG